MSEKRVDAAKVPASQRASVRTTVIDPGCVDVVSVRTISLSSSSPSSAFRHTIKLKLLGAELCGLHNRLWYSNLEREGAEKEVKTRVQGCSTRQRHMEVQNC